VSIDFRSFGAKGPVTNLPDGQSLRWWTLKSNTEIANSISGVLRFLKDHQTERVKQSVVGARLYGNMGMFGLAGISYSAIASVSAGMRDRVTYNVIQSVIDTLQSKMAKNKPKPYFLTSGGNYKEQRKAKKLNQFVEGVFYENKAYEFGSNAFRDGCVWGDGIVHVFERNGRVCFERVVNTELFVDEIEAFDGNPRSMHRVKSIDRDILYDLFPNHHKDIEEAKEGDQSSKNGNYPNVADMVEVRESWHLPSGPDAEDGLHIISLQDKVLFKEAWKHDFFPFARFKWCPKLYGYWAQGLAEQLQNIQMEINKLLWLVQRSFHMAGTFKVFLENGSKVVKEHLNNDIGIIINYTGKPPVFYVPQIVPPEIFQHLLTLKQSAYEQAGVSALNATSEKPAGLNSGKALREYDDINTDRFQTVGQAYQAFYLDLAKLAIATIKDISEDNKGSYEVTVPGKRFLKTIDWKDIDLEDDQYVMQCYPISSLPNDPEGRLQTIQEYVQAGWISPREGRRLMDFPDLDQVETLANAEEEYLMEVLDKIADDGDYTPPEPMDNLQMAMELGQWFYAVSKMQNADQDKQELLRTWIQQVAQLMQKAQQGQMQQMAAQQALTQQNNAPAPGGVPNVPQGVAQLPPTSDLQPTQPLH
jgi:hypothetical protein